MIDSNCHVKSSLATSVMGLAPLVGKEDTITHFFIQQLKYENSGVRVNIISNIEQVNNVLEFEQLSTNLLRTIVELSSDSKWRVRLAIIDNFPLLASQLGRKFFDDQLKTVCLAWLVDHVYAIREAAVNYLTRFTEIFGVEWAESMIVPRVS